MIQFQTVINIILTYIIFKNKEFNITNFIVGMCIWTFFEYIIHRFIFHTYIYKKYHMKHHKYPLNVKYLVGPYILGIPINLFLFFTTQINTYYGIANAYLIYELTHYFIHYYEKTKFIKILANYHNKHHLSYKKNYGFITPFYDILFNTVDNDDKNIDKKLALIYGPIPLLYFFCIYLKSK